MWPGAIRRPSASNSGISRFRFTRRRRSRTKRQSDDRDQRPPCRRRTDSRSADRTDRSRAGRAVHHRSSEEAVVMRPKCLRAVRGIALFVLSLAFARAAAAQQSLGIQLNENCTISVLNRNVRVRPDGSWVLPNVPANFGQVRARVTCIVNGPTVSADGLVTAVKSGTVIVQATLEGASGMTAIRIAFAGVDTDRDGIPDDYEIAHGLNPNNPVDAQEDPDHDGLTNLQEYQLGTDP